MIILFTFIPGLRVFLYCIRAVIWFRSHLVISGKNLECMQRQGHRELLPFDLEPEQTLHRLRREAHVTQPEIM